MKTNKKTAIVTILVLCIALIISACSGGNNLPSSSNSSSSNNPPANTGENNNADSETSEEPIKIGGVYSKSGPLAFAGGMMLTGAQAAVQMVNDEGGINGRMLEFIIEDDETKPENSARLMEKFATNSEIVFVSGGLVSALAAAMDPVAREYETPLMLVTGAGYHPEGEGKEWVTAPNIHFDHAIEGFIEYAIDQGWTRGATLNPTDTSGQLIEELMDQMMEKFESQGLEIIVRERYDASSVDVTPQLAKIKAQNPDFLLSYGAGESAAIVANQSVQVGLNVPIALSGANSFPAFLKLINENVPNEMLYTYTDKIIMLDDLPDDDPQKPILEKYYNTFKKMFPEDEPNLTHTAGAQSILIGVEAIKEVGTDREKIKQFLSQGNQNIISILSDSYNLTVEDRWGGVNTPVIITNVDGQWVVSE